MDCTVMALPVKSAKECEEYTESGMSRITYRSLFWLFLFGSIAGFILEGLWCILRKGAWESHPATVWGPFCIIYGFGAAAVYLISTVMTGKRPLLQFILFSVSGAMVEYFGSLLQETVFGSTSWDYSSHFMNIEGRVSLKMAAAWGVLGMIFVRLAFPLLVRVLEKMEDKFWRIGCLALSVFMAVNLLLSAAAVMRWKNRLAGNIPAANAFEQFLDETYGNNAMEKRYPNMKFSGRDGKSV